MKTIEKDESIDTHSHSCSECGTIVIYPKEIDDLSLLKHKIVKPICFDCTLKNPHDEIERVKSYF